MGQYQINKGIGRTVEFKGLKSQYLFIFAGGLLAVFIVTIVLYMIGVSQLLSMGIGLIGATVLVWLTFKLNTRYGEHGLMKRAAKKSHPRYITNRIPIYKLINNAKYIKNKYSSE